MCATPILRTVFQFDQFFPTLYTVSERLDRGELTELLESVFDPKHIEVTHISSHNELYATKGSPITSSFLHDRIQSLKMQVFDHTDLVDNEHIGFLHSLSDELAMTSLPEFKKWFLVMIGSPACAISNGDCQEAEPNVPAYVHVVEPLISKAARPVGATISTLIPRSRNRLTNDFSTVDLPHPL